MTTGVWVLGDQLWAGQSALQSCQATPEQTPVLFIESLHPPGQPMATNPRNSPTPHSRHPCPL
ncbi:MAG: hypothetical protein MUF49_23055 [Oculatellaceae cyanobacterium Prado106]|nr:hypothetical protein [Oculatellaceae cyanobacterium Prado106]